MSVYTWGLGKNGQLGIGISETQHIPQLVKTTDDGKRIKRIKGIDCGALFTTILTSDGEVLCAGCGKYGRLGNGNTEEDADRPKLVILHKALENYAFSQVSCGSWHAAGVTDDGALVIWGYQKAFLKEISPKSNVGLPTLIVLPSKVAGVSCGHNYCFAWTTEGSLYSWGKCQNGVLGHGVEEDIPSPEEVKTLNKEKIIAVGAGHSHCGIVTEAGRLYMTGKGSDGALGLGKSCLQNATLPTPCETELGIKSVSCSKGEHHGHTLALTLTGSLLVWGDGYKGKLGLGSQESQFTPTVLPPEYFNNEAVTSISAGGIHSAAATGSGDVYTWGCGSDGRLGHPEGQGHRYLFRSDIPKKVEGLPKGSQAVVKCSYYHSAALIFS